MAHSGTVTAQITRAQAAVRRGAMDEAQALYRSVLDRFPANRRAAAGLRDLQGDVQPSIARAHALYRSGDLAAALTMAEALEDGAAAVDLRAACLRGLDRPDEALVLYRAALETRAEEAGLWYNCGAVLVDLGRLDDADPCLVMAARLAPDVAKHWTALAQCRDKRGHYGGAYDAISQALAREPQNAAALNLLGVVLRNLGRLELAKQAHKRVLDHGADTHQTASAHNSLGILAAALGDRDAARGHYRDALDHAPDNTQARLNLVRLSKGDTDAQEIAQMQDLLERPDLSLRDQSNLHFALFAARHRTDPGDARSFDHLARGNALRRKELRYDPANDATIMRMIEDRFSDLPALGSGASGPRPVFVVGLPRSGTTLTEQILAQTPGTHGAGELTVVNIAAHALLRRTISEGDAGPSRDALTEFATTLRQNLHGFAQGADVIIDKMPLNFRWIGPVLAALPEARVVHIHRDPVETSWSNYKISYASDGNKFAYDQSDLVAYHGLYRRIMSVWRARYPDRILDLSYTDLTTDLDTQSRRMTEFCGLTWVPDCLHPERSRNAVMTASAQQVRKPVYNGNVQSWRCYETQLAPLISGLKSVGCAASSLSKACAQG